MVSRRSHALALLLLGASALSWGCAESTERWPEAGADWEGYETRRFALMTVVSEPTIAGDELEATAQFVEYRGPDDGWALQALDLWLPPTEFTEYDVCRVDTEPFAAPDALEAEDMAIRLLYAGDVSLVHVSTSELEQFSLPGIQTYLSGVFYELKERVALPRAVHFVSTGASEVDAFSLAAQMPESIRISAVDGLPRGAFDVLPLADTRDLLIEWNKASEGDVVYFDLYDDARSAASLVSCVARDDGIFRIPSGSLRQVVERYPDAALRLVARRASLVEASLPGFEWAKAVVEAADVVFLTKER